MNAVIVIKKYGNRRLYDTQSSAYINLEQLAGLIRQGRQVQVQDARTGQDLTREVLLQVLLEVLHGGELFPAPLLHRIIRATGDNPWSRMTHQQISAGLQLLSSQLDQAERLMGPLAMGLPGPFGVWPGQPTPKPPTPAGRPPRPEPIPGEPIPGEPIPGEPIPGEPIPGEPIPGEPIPGEPIPGERAAPTPADSAREQLEDLRARLADLERRLKG